jgi:hypothetical protein
MTELSNEALKELMEERDRRYQERFDASEKARENAYDSMQDRLESMNEFRTTLKDQAATFFTRTEHESYMKSVEVDLRLLRESRAELAGAAKQSSVQIALLIAGVGMVTASCGVGLSIVTLALHLMKVI